MRALLLCCLVTLVISAAVKHESVSEHDHFEHGEHNPDFDHDAFLGKEEAKRFDDLTDEESQEALKKLVVNIDKDGDGFITHEELRDWIQYVQHKYIKEDTDRQWKEQTLEADGKLAWKSFMKKTFGYETEEDMPTGEGYDYKEMIRRDKRRWETADQDKDGLLSYDEFRMYMHPEDNKPMHDVVVTETMEDMDKNKDGLITLEEYLGDMYPESEKGAAEEPEWVQSERNAFVNIRDANKDGNMDKEELARWILPDEYDHAESEARHLLAEADSDKDGKLTSAEILEKHDLFVGSQATDFGDALVKHDEF